MTPVVTAILASVKREGRFDIMIDGRIAATIGLDVIERLSLRIGRELSVDDVTALERDAEIARAIDRALDMIAFRARSRNDLARRLRQKGEPDDLIALVVQRLTHLGLLDDAAYARHLARSRVVGGGVSARHMRAELLHKGVDRTVVDEAIAEVLSEEGIDEKEMLERVARKKFKVLARLDPAMRRRRLYAFLMRRGYKSEDICNLMRRLDREQEADPE